MQYIVYLLFYCFCIIFILSVIYVFEKLNKLTLFNFLALCFDDKECFLRAIQLFIRLAFIIKWRINFAFRFNLLSGK